MKKIMCFFFLFSLFLSAETNWETDYSKAVEKAKLQKKAILIDFYADWCGPCKIMDETTLKDPKVLKELNSFILVKVDIDKSPILAQKYSVSSIPHLILLNQYQEEVASIKGLQASKEFTDWLLLHKRNALSKNHINELHEEDLKLVRSLESSITSAEEVAGLFFSYPSEKQQALFSEISKLPNNVLADCLSSSQLRVRILFSKALLSKNDDMQYDAWASEKIRDQQLKKIREQLAP